MKKPRYIGVTKNNFNSIINSCKILSESLEDSSTIIKQFNSLTAQQRLNIVKEHLQREDLLKKQITPGYEDMYLTCAMVNFNIIASKYDIDPATVCMCISQKYKANEKILVV